MDTQQMHEMIRAQLDLSQRLRARIAELESERHEPVAVIGTALRFPGGVTTPDQYWKLLLGDATTEGEIPVERTGLRSVSGPDGTGQAYVDKASFVDDVDLFDAAFFGISGREATMLDPQQRLLLETCWEAAERAGLAVRRNDRLRAGVFVGMMTSDYVDRLARHGDLSNLDPYYGTGGGHSLAAGRVSYALGLAGPAVSIDTACSSSLMAAHLAMQSLRRGECDYAFVGGANLLFSPEMMVSLCRSGALAPDGRCKSFLDSADGYGRGEGVGVVLLTRLAVAERQRHPVRAVLRGSAANHDGASSGLTVPNGRAQQDVMRAALADASVRPADVDYVEAHGTGTKVGDPIEIASVDAVLGSGAPERTAPLLLGTVKARIGHLEGAAGIAGIIKLALMLERGHVPPSVRADDGPLNSLVRWDEIGVVVPREGMSWPSGPGTRVAGISAFGMSGTNVHLVMEQYVGTDAAARVAPRAESPRAELLVVSTKRPESLAVAAERVARFLDRAPAHSVDAACHTLRAGRVHHAHRLAVVAAGADDLAAALREAVRRGPDGEAPTSGASYAGPVHLRVASTDRLALLATGLHRRWPELAGATGATDPAGALVSTLRSLGLAVEVVPGEPEQGAVADLSWRGVTARLDGVEADAEAALLRLVAVLYRSGARVDLSVLADRGTPLLGDLPTYPFDRRRFWVDEAPAVPAPAAPATAAPATAVPVSAVPVAAVAHVIPQRAAPPRRADVVEGVFAALEAVLEAEEPLDRGLAFLDVGGDSFTAMQLTVDLERRFGVALPAGDIDLEQPLSIVAAEMAELVLTAMAAPVVEFA